MGSQSGSDNPHSLRTKQKYADQLLDIAEADTVRLMNIECPTLMNVLQECDEFADGVIRKRVGCSSVSDV